MEAHVNVEVCCSSASVKYLYKYVHKGPDRAMARVDVDAGNDQHAQDGIPHHRNEVKEYQDMRSIGSSEAC